MATTTTTTRERYTHEQLSAAFDLVRNPSDWRAEIAWTGKLSDSLLAQVCDAIVYFTATQPTVQQLGEGRVYINAVGYRMGPAGP